MNRLFLRFPGGRCKALTLSYDDGVGQDARLIDIMNKHGIKGTFNLNSAPLSEGEIRDPKPSGTFRMNAAEAVALYKNSGHEVAVHGMTHPFLDRIPAASALDEVIGDRKVLERLFGGTVRGMAYPFATTSDALVEALRHSGIAYARTGVSTGKFDIPTDWLRMPATCHHNNPHLMELAETFLSSQPPRWNTPWLFYLWGHSYEFDVNNNWDVIERFCERMGGHEDVWYATNIEIYDYVKAYHRLEFNVELTRVHNPSAIPVWFMIEGWLEEQHSEYVVSPGETIEL